MLLAALAAIAVFRFFGNPLDPFAADRFDSARWRAVDPDDRAHMCRDLIQTYLRAGMTKSEVRRFIGPPDKTTESDETQSKRAHTESYDLGYWRLHGVGHAFLCVDFDGNDQLVRAEIRGMQ